MAEARLYVNGSKDDRDALEAVQQAGITYSLGGPLESKETPLLVTGTSAHLGLPRILEYLHDIEESPAT